MFLHKKKLQKWIKFDGNKYQTQQKTEKNKVGVVRTLREYTKDTI